MINQSMMTQMISKIWELGNTPLKFIENLPIYTWEWVIAEAIHQASGAWPLHVDNKGIKPKPYHISLHTTLLVSKVMCLMDN